MLVFRRTDKVTDKLRRYQENLPVPALRSIQQSVPIFKEYRIFHWGEEGGFKLTEKWESRINHFFDQQVREGKLARGRQNPRSWLGFQVVRKLIDDFITDAIVNGSRNFDVIVSQVLSILLISSTMARVGDITVSMGYDRASGFYSKWRDVVIKIDGPTASLAHLKIAFSLPHTKGHKGERNTEIIKILEPLPSDSGLQRMDPCLWILIMAMRTGQTKPTLRDVLRDAFARPDKRVVWKRPNLPLLPTRNHSKVSLDLKKAAKSHQVSNTLKAMAKLSGLEGRAYAHGLRLGAARDAANLPPAALAGGGFANDNVRQLLGHTHQAMLAGTTDDYVGGPTTSAWNAIAENSNYFDPRRPTFDTSAATAERSKDDVIGLPSDEETDDDDDDDSDEDEDAFIDDDTMNFVQDCVASGTSAPLINDSDDDDDEYFVEESDETTMQAASAGMDLAIEDAALNVMEAPSHQTTNEDFVTDYSKFNVVRNDSWHQQFLKSQRNGTSMPEEILEVYPTDPLLLNSRDPASPFVFTCCKTTGCTYTTQVASSAAQHDNTCNEILVQQRRDQAALRAANGGIACQECLEVLLNQASFARHMREMHAEWEPKPCEQGCNPTHVYQHQRGYDEHQKAKHNPDGNRFPANCSITGCTDKSKFNQISDLRAHLEDAHDLWDEEHRPYLPLTGTSMNVWRKEQPCLSIALYGSDCKIVNFPSTADMKKHLKIKAHGMSEAAAKYAIETHGIYDVVEKPVRLVPRKRPTTDNSPARDKKKTTVVDAVSERTTASPATPKKRSKSS